MTVVNTPPRKTPLPPVLVERLDEVRRRDASLKLVAGLLDALSLFLVALFFALSIDWAFTLFSTSIRSLLTYVALGGGGAALIALAIVPRFKRRTLPELAATVDRSVPDLEERWETVTRLNSSNDPESITGSPVMFERVVAESVAQSPRVDVQQVVPAKRLRKHQGLLAAALGANVLLFLIDPAQAWVLVKRFCSPTAPISLTQITTSGDVAVPRGEPVRLEAAISGRTREKANVFLRDSAGKVTAVSLAPSDRDGKQFVHAIDSAEAPFSYRFRAGDGETAWHDVAIYDRPRLTNVELKLTPPEYTHLPAVTKSELPTSLRAVEGTRLEVSFSVDQPLGRFDLQLGPDSSQPLSPKGSDQLQYVFQTKLEKTLRLTPVFVSRHGLSNLRPPSCQIIVYPDRPPDVAIISPEREISLRPNDQVTIEFGARDDFGVVRAELIAFVGDQPDMKNAVVLPAPSGSQPEKGQNAKNVSPAKGSAAETKNATLKKGMPSNDSQPSAGGDKTAAPAKGHNPPSSQPEKTAPSPDGKPEAADASKTPPQTVVMPIPLGAQSGEKNVRGKIKLDLRQFQLKQGQQLQYMVRVYDSRSAQSNGQSYGDAGKSAESMANGQDSKGRKADSARSASRAQSPSEAAKKAASERVAQRTKPQASAPRKETRMADASDRRKSPNSKPSDRAAKATASQSAASSSQQSSSAKKTSAKEQSPGDVTGAPRPPDAMTRRRLDVDSQSTASSTMRIHIDRWAGSFEGQQRRKLEILIDPVLKELDATLAKAIEELRPITDAYSEGRKPAEDDVKKELRAGDTQIARGQSLVGDLVQKTDGTPYAFIGLQLVDITELHVSPARPDAKAARSDSPERKDQVQHAEVHLTRAREMLADLTRKYESVKRDLRLADEMQRIKTMYQVFLENTMAFLAANRPTLNPKDRKMAQLELDKDFLKQYRELQEEWEKTLADLAKVLAKDPRLLARYMSLSRRRVDTLRDQLSLLNLRQQELLVPVQQLSGEAPPAGAQKPGGAADSGDAEQKKEATSPKDQIAAGVRAVRATLSRDLGEIASETMTLQEDIGTWMPQKMKDDPKTVALREQAVKISSLATAAALAAGNPKAGKAAEAGKQVDALAKELKSFEAALSKLAVSDDAALAVPLNRRLARIRKLQQLTAAWTQKNAHVAAGRFHRVLEMDQHRLSEDTLTLAGKLETANAQLAGLPDDILTLADEVKDAMRYDVLVEQMSAELGLRDGNLPTAKAHQQKAIEGFARAEERFNKLIDRVIEEQDKVPPQVPDLDNFQLPTLEDLLARLESEADLAELLGIPDRPNNLQGFRDWMNNQNGGGMGMGALQARARLLEQARRDALRAAREAQKSGGRARPMATAAHWNTLGSRLEDAVRQGRGNMPPRQYRRAIERYFELISGATNSGQNLAPGAVLKENGKKNGNAAPTNPAGER
jgi:hypothetical protein